MSSPVTSSIATAVEALDQAADRALFAAVEDDLVTDLEAAHRLVARAQEVELRIAQQLAARDADAHTLWTRSTRQTPRASRARLRLAEFLDSHEPTRSAISQGRLDEAQAEAIRRSVDELTSNVDADVIAEAEHHLIGEAAEHHADDLRTLGRRLFEVADPDAAETHEAKRVDAEYRRAIERCRFTMTDDLGGLVHGHFVLSIAHAHMLRKLLLALAAPKHRAATQGCAGERLPSPQRMGLALSELIERYPVDRIPYSGGISARAMVTIDHSQLTDALGASGVATMDDLVALPAWVARRMACDAGILPAVLNTQGAVLDLGRSRRFHNEPMRIVIHRRDKVCRADGCGTPAAMCHVHHRIPWSRGGHTDVRTGMTLCHRHHARAHDPTYEMTAGKHGTVVFSRT